MYIFFILHIFFSDRFTGSDELRREVSLFVTANPLLVTHIPAALQYLATSSNIEDGRPEVSRAFFVLYVFF